MNTKGKNGCRVRVVHNWNLLLVEEALAICIWYGNSQVHGYTLASDYFRNYDPRYGSSLNGPSRTRSSWRWCN